MWLLSHRLATPDLVPHRCSTLDHILSLLEKNFILLLCIMQKVVLNQLKNSQKYMISIYLLPKQMPTLARDFTRVEGSGHGFYLVMKWLVLDKRAV